MTGVFQRVSESAIQWVKSTPDLQTNMGFEWTGNKVLGKPTILLRAHTEEKRCDGYSDGSANGHYDCCSWRVKVAVVDVERRTENGVESGMPCLAWLNAQKGNVTHATNLLVKQKHGRPFSEEQTQLRPSSFCDGQPKSE